MIVSWLAEVTHQTTLGTDEMVMRRIVGIETGGSAQASDTSNDTPALEEAECTIDRIERNGWHTSLNAAVEGLSVGVFICSRELTKHLKSLMGHLHSATFAGCHKARLPPRKRSSIDSHTAFLSR
jgi:hypothetical protein